MFGLAHETGFILSTFPTSSFPEENSTWLIIPSDPDQKPTIRHQICVAYKYSAVGGINDIDIQEGEEVKGKRQIKLSFNGYTTGHKEVAVTTTRLNLREGLRQLISIGREAGGKKYLESPPLIPPLNHPPTTFYSDFLP